MSMKPNVIIVSGKCSVSKGLFGLRLEEVELKNWVIDWAFPVKEKSAKREGYSKNRVMGEFFFSEDYPGCPYCESQSLFKCQCGKIGCYEEKVGKATCSWCGLTSEIRGTVSSIDGNTDI